MLTLSRTVPAHKKTIRFTSCQLDFLEMNPRFRAIRARSRRPLDHCGWCSHPFADGEMIALAIPETGKNKVLCQECAIKLLGP